VRGRARVEKEGEIYAVLEGTQLFRGLYRPLRGGYATYPRTDEPFYEHSGSLLRRAEMETSDSSRIARPVNRGWLVKQRKNL